MRRQGVIEMFRAKHFAIAALREAGHPEVRSQSLGTAMHGLLDLRRLQPSRFGQQYSQLAQSLAAERLKEQHQPSFDEIFD